MGKKETVSLFTVLYCFSSLPYSFYILAVTSAILYGLYSLLGKTFQGNLYIIMTEF